MKRSDYLAIVATVAAWAAASMLPVSVQDKVKASPIYGVTIPPGYRDWHLISFKQLTRAGGRFNQLRAQQGLGGTHQ
ncbi:MAG TPA: hypothetical protein VF447_11875 [Terriglobales bacterium]